MINILVVDDIQENLDVMELLIEEYMDDNNTEEYTLKLLSDSTKALETIEQNSIDILFLDIMMPQIDGFEILQQLRSNTTIKQPIVVMATALGDDITKQKEQKLGANAFIVKPISHKVIAIMLDRYIKILESQSFEVDDEFDFDFDFDDLDNNENDSNSNENNNVLNDIINKRYETLSAEDFMQNYDYIEDIIEDKIDQLDHFIFEVFESADDDIDLYLEVENIVKILDQTKELLSKFRELEDLYICIVNLSKKLTSTDLDTVSESNQIKISTFLKTIIFDIVELKDQIFVERSTNNIYYAHASIASACLQINNYLK